MFVDLTYRDGSANAYHFHAEGDEARVEYVPVTPAQSSTGTYSGGAPRSGRLDAATCADLWQRVTELAGNAAIHATDREKGTGQFVIVDANGETMFLIARGPELAAFDAFVAGLQ